MIILIPYLYFLDLMRKDCRNISLDAVYDYLAGFDKDMESAYN